MEKLCQVLLAIILVVVQDVQCVPKNITSMSEGKIFVHSFMKKNLEVLSLGQCCPTLSPFAI
jgi:hypothetical protein